MVRHFCLFGYLGLVLAGCSLPPARHVQPYLLNAGTPFREEAVDPGRLAGQQFVVHHDHLHFDLTTILQHRDRVEITDVRHQPNGQVEVRLRSLRTGQTIEQWYRPRDLGLISGDAWQQLRRHAREQCKSSADAEKALDRQASVGMLPACVEVAWGRPLMIEVDPDTQETVWLYGDCLAGWHRDCQPVPQRLVRLRQARVVAVDRL